jgi:hypothetical protein
MKTRNGFISNSSSTSFYITNKSDHPISLVEFAIENSYLLESFLDEFDWYKGEPKFTQEKMITSAINRNIKFKPGQRRTCVFGDEQGDTIGHVYDYALRAGGESENFKWEFKEYNR